MSPQCGWTGPRDNLELPIAVGVISRELFNKYAWAIRSNEESIYMSSKRRIVPTKAADRLSHMANCLYMIDADGLVMA